MKISLNWIKEYVPVDVSVETIVQRLTMAGIEAENIEKAGKDTVIEFEITPNRPDCLSMIGMSREIAAALDLPLTVPKIKKRTLPAERCDVTVEDSGACPRYIGTLIREVSVRRTTDSRLLRITALGSRSISNVVDVTNFCLQETGQPLHAFDFDRLAGGKIIVRFAREGETLVTLDGVERTLDPSVLVIADAQRPVALAGIMGGVETEVTSRTKTVLLESASFDPVLIRRTVRRLGLSSDSSFRFERGTAFDNVAFGADRAVDLILEAAGGRVVARTDTAGKRPHSPRPIPLNLEKMNTFLGAEISGARAKKILKALGFRCVSGNTGELSAEAPWFRRDIQRPQDLYEEVARVIGYDNLPSSFPVVRLNGLASSPGRERRLKITDCLLSQGLNEVVTYSLVSRETVSRFGLNSLSAMSILNPLSREQDVLRPHLLPSLLGVVQTNVNRGQKDLAVFETGKVYPESGERETLGIVLCGCLRSDWRGPAPRPFDFFDVKGVVERVLVQAGASGVVFREGSESFLEKGERSDIFLGQTRLGSCGRVAGDVLEQAGIRADQVCFAQIDMEALYAIPARKKRYCPVCDFPAISRDVSIAVDQGVSFAQVCDVVREFGGENLTRIDFREEYLGDKIPPGQRGLVFSVMYQSPARTLTEDEISVTHEALCRKLQERTGAVIR